MMVEVPADLLVVFDDEFGEERSGFRSSGWTASQSGTGMELKAYTHLLGDELIFSGFGAALECSTW